MHTNTFEIILFFYYYVILDYKKDIKYLFELYLKGA